MLKQSLSQKLLQKLSPQQIQFIKLLELNTLNFEQKVEEELIDNPALESAKDGEDVSSGDDDDYDYPNDYDDNESYDSVDDNLDISDYLNDDYGGVQLNDQFGGDDEEKDYIPINSSLSFRERLMENVKQSLQTEKEYLLADQLIGTIDDDGYLRRPLRSIVNDLLFSANVRTSENELEKILKIIQNQEPAGIGARTLQECLLLQIRAKAKIKNTAITKLAEEIVELYMEDFSKKHYSQLLRKLDVTEDFLKEAITFIAKLNPKPAGSGDSGGRQTDYIIPDFIVRESYGELEVELNNRNTPILKVSPSYMETLKGYEKAKKPDKSVKDAVQFIKQKLDSAKWFVDSVKQRQNTLLVTMRAIVEIQREYFLSGDETKLKPMILKDIAERVNLDVSTISRVASSKYVETDFGIFLLKHFFSEGIVTSSGSEVSNKEVKKILSEAIASEDKKKPLTDGKLQELLKEKGYNIARRTVAKYREQLQIPVARLRKELI